MSGKQVQWRRGTTAQHAGFTGAIGEVTVDTTLKTLRVHDGSTAGGTPLLTTLGSGVLRYDGVQSLSAAEQAQARANANLDVGTQIFTTGGHSAVVADRGGVLIFTTNAQTLTLVAAATLGADWFIDVVAYDVAVTIDPNSSETIDGAATLVVPPGRACRIWSTGSAIRSSLGGSQLRLTNYTPTFTAFGTVSVHSVWWGRFNDMLLLRGNFTLGTPTAAEARLSMPSGLTSDATKVPAIQRAGAMIRSSSGATIFTVLIESGASYITFGFQVAGSGGLTKQNGDQLGASSNVLSFDALIPISGW
jgi:hypothetical protein